MAAEGAETFNQIVWFSKSITYLALNFSLPSVTMRMRTHNRCSVGCDDSEEAIHSVKFFGNVRSTIVSHHELSVRLSKAVYVRCRQESHPYRSPTA